MKKSQGRIFPFMVSFFFLFNCNAQEVSPTLGQQIDSHMDLIKDKTNAGLLKAEEFFKNLTNRIEETYKNTRVSLARGWEAVTHRFHSIKQSMREIKAKRKEAYLNSSILEALEKKLQEDSALTTNPKVKEALDLIREAKKLTDDAKEEADEAQEDLENIIQECHEKIEKYKEKVIRATQRAAQKSQFATDKATKALESIE